MSDRDKNQSNSARDKALYEYLINNKRPLRIDNSLIRLTAIIVGTLIIILGYLLFIKGVTGEASISINSKSISGQLLNAAPGLFFAISGVIVTNPSVVI